MATLTSHLRRSEDHGRLPFHPDCPICRAERLSGTLPAPGLVGRRTQAVIVAGMLVASTATPTVAVAQEADQVTEGAAAPDQAASDFDPGGDSADLPFSGPEVPDIEAEPVDDVEAPVADTGDAPTAAPVSTPAPTTAAPPAAPTPTPSPPSPPRTVPELQTPGARTARPQLALEATADRERTPVVRPAEPAVRLVSATPKVAPTDHAITGRAEYHVVAKGESLWSIARDALGGAAPPAAIAREVNRLWTLNSARIATGDPDLLRVGTKLALR